MLQNGVKTKIAALPYIATALMFLLVIVFLYLPLARRVVVKKTEFSRLSADLAGAKLAIESLHNLREDCRLIKDSEVPSIINSISKKGRELEVDIKSMDQMDPRTVPGKCRALPIRIEAEARYDAIGKFMTELESLGECVITIDSFRVQKNERSKLTVDSSIVISIYLEPV